MDYKDILLKSEIYKQLITQSLIKNGIYPSNAIVTERLGEIDTRLALFKHKLIAEGEMFDVDQFNDELAKLYKDLELIYLLTYEHVEKEYLKTKSKMGTMLEELEWLAERNKIRTAIETSSTQLGKTILYKSGALEIRYKDGLYQIPLGKVDALAGTNLLCLAYDSAMQHINAGNNSVFFVFEDDDSSYSCGLYNVSGDMLTIAFKNEATIYNIELEPDQIVNGRFSMTPSNLKPSAANQYIILGGKNKVRFVNTNNAEILIDKYVGKAINFSSGKIEFIVYKSSYINFNFAGHITNKNFSGTNITNPKTHTKIIIETDSEATVDFITDGQIYGVAQKGVVLEQKLYCPTATLARDFAVHEYKFDQQHTYSNVTLCSNDKDTIDKVKHIVIKQTPPSEVLI